jgi:hypothetical protein
VDGAALSGVTAATNAKFAYRVSTDATGAQTAITVGWVTTSQEASYVKSQIDDSLTERTYVSTLDGSVQPLVISNEGIFAALGGYKRLGVPAPHKPVVTHNVVNQYTVDEDREARTNIPIQIKGAIVGSASLIAIGDVTGFSAPAGSDAGWLAHGTSVSVGTLPTSTTGDWAFLVPMSGGVILPAAKSDYLMGTEFGGRQVTYSGVVYWAVPVSAQGTGYSINTTTLTENFRLINNPDPGVTNAGVPNATYTYASQFLTNALCASTSTDVAAMYATTTLPQSDSIAALARAKTAVISAVAAAQNQTILSATVTAFYAKTDVAAEITAAISNFGNEILSAETRIVTSPIVYGSSTPAGDTPATAAWTVPTLTVKANITTQVNTNISTSAVDGSKVLDTEGLRAWVTTEINTVIDAISGATLYTAGDLLRKKVELKAAVAASISPALLALERTIQVSHWTSRSDWPLGTSAAVSEIAGNRATAVAKALADLKAAARRITQDYADITARLVVSIDGLFNAKGGFAESLPTPVSSLTDTRFYVTTLVTDWGEESAPSPVSSLLTVASSDTVTVTKPTAYAVAHPAETVFTDRHIVGWRLYRSNSGSDTTQFQLVEDTASGAWSSTYNCFLIASNYTDAKKSMDLREVLPSSDWLEPPYQLRHLTGMANGIMAGYYDNVVCFCEAYIPYGWPLKYHLTTKYPIVGLGSFGQTLFVGTRGSPYLISGADPSSMSMIELPSNQACSSARSIVSVGDGVVYASPDGLCLADNGGVVILTEGLYAREDWQAIKPETIFAELHDGVYYFVYNTAGVSGTPATSVCYAFDFVARKLIKTNIQCSAFYVEKLTDTLYCVTGSDLTACTQIKAVFGGATKRTALYKTGIMKFPTPQPLAWLQVDSDFSASVTIEWYGDGTLRHTATVSSITPQRLPAGRYLEHEVRVTSTARITSVTLAGSTDELQSV